MGCVINDGRDFIEVAGSSSLCGVDIDMRDIPDTAQTLAAIAPFTSSPTRIRGIASARVKETDRIRATCVELARLGVQVDEHEDGMTIYPCDQFHARYYSNLQRSPHGNGIFFDRLASGRSDNRKSILCFKNLSKLF